MKKIIFASLLIVANTTFADYKWDSYYVGASAGAAFGDATNKELSGNYNGTGTTIEYNANGGILSIFGGKNWLLPNNFLIGTEANIGYMNISNKKQLPSFVGVRGPTDSVASTNNGMFVSLSGRFGKIFNENTLIYTKGGFIQTNIRQSFIDDDPAGATITSGKSTSRNSGPFFGLGIEYATLRNLSLLAEYNHYNFGSAEHTATTSASTSVIYNEKFNFETLTFGALYKF